MYYARAAHAFSAEIDCQHCRSEKTWLYDTTQRVYTCPIVPCTSPCGCMAKGVIRPVKHERYLSCIFPCILNWALWLYSGRSHTTRKTRKESTLHIFPCILNRPLRLYSERGRKIRKTRKVSILHISLYLKLGLPVL